jgi:hypothetical protein
MLVAIFCFALTLWAGHYCSANAPHPKTFRAWFGGPVLDAVLLIGMGKGINAVDRGLTPRCPHRLGFGSTTSSTGRLSRNWVP